MPGPNFKIILAGDERVGKTSLIRRFVDNNFSIEYLPTLGFQIFVKTLQIGNLAIDFTVWDIAGQPQFEIIRRTYYHDARGFLLVYDLNEPKSRLHLNDWINELKSVCPTAPFVLVGNKVDLLAKNENPSKKDPQHNELGAFGRVLTSAKTGEKVPDAFELLGRAILTSLGRSN